MNKISNGMKIVTVIPLQKGTNRGDLTYFSAKEIPDGSIVTIPFRNKKILGLVVSSENARNVKSNIKDLNFNLKKILGIKEHSIFREEYLKAALEAGNYFATSKNNMVTSLIPSAFREEYDKIAKFQNSEARPNTLGLASSNKSEKLLFQAPLEDRISSYKTLIRESFASNKSVFIVLPTEHDIKIFQQSLSKGIEQFTFAIHGGLSVKKLIEKWRDIITLEHGVLILGTTPFLSIPRQDLGVIILEHESSNAYKMIPKPHADLRIFTEIFASKINAKLILSDSLLRFESIARGEIDGLSSVHPLVFRINFDGQIKIENPNKKTDALLPFLNGSKASVFKVLSNESAEEIQNAIARKKNVFIFTLRKGLATQTICKDCNNLLVCEKCGAPLVLHLSHEGKKRIFVCNRCQSDTDGDTVCPICQSWNLIPLGIGTDTVSEYVKTIFPKTKILILDKEKAKTTKGAEKIIKEFEESEGSILIGTEMAFFYLKNKVPLSVIASFDSLWSIPNFRMSEKVIQLIISIISNTENKLIIQTKNATDPIILAIKNGNLLSFICEELEDRKKLGYPPFKRFIKITHLGNKTETLSARAYLAEIFKEYSPEIFSGFISKIEGKYVTNALIKIDTKKWSLPELSLGATIDQNLLSRILSLPPRFEIFVDPEDLL